MDNESIATTMAMRLANRWEKNTLNMAWSECESSCDSTSDEYSDADPENSYFYRTFEFYDGSAVRFEAYKKPDGLVVPGRYMDILEKEQ